MHIEPTGAQPASTPYVSRPEAVFLAQVRVLAGTVTDARARLAVRAVLAVLGEHLPDGLAHLLAAELAPEIGRPLWCVPRRRLGSRQPDQTRFFAAVAERAAVTPQRAARLTQAVLTTLEHTVDAPLLRRAYGALTDGPASTGFPHPTTRQW
jgi:uncharacterized protein (DUF2267 family)